MESKMEAEGDYHVSFTMDQQVEIQTHFREKGYVVVRGLLSKEECKATLDEMNEEMRRVNAKFNLYDPLTFSEAPIINNFGLHTKRPVFTPAFLHNRQNPGIVSVFKLLLEEEHILVNHDRCAFYRPTQKNPEWKTAYTFPGLHLDFHPSSYFNHKELVQKREMLDYKTTDDFIAENNLFCETDKLEVQAVLNLMDNKEEDGGYQCTPGFHKGFAAWWNEKKETEREEKILQEGVYHFSRTDKIDMRYVGSPIRVPVPEGAVIFWSQFLAHGTRPNNSNQPRCIQFLKAFPQRIFSKERLKRRGAALKKLCKTANFIPSKTGRSVFGF